MWKKKQLLMHLNNFEQHFYGEANGKPITDPANEREWKLESITEEGGVTTLTVSRMVEDSGDEKGVTITVSLHEMKKVFNSVRSMIMVSNGLKYMNRMGLCFWSLLGTLITGKNHTLKERRFQM